MTRRMVALIGAALVLLVARASAAECIALPSTGLRVDVSSAWKVDKEARRLPRGQSGDLLRARYRAVAVLMAAGGCDASPYGAGFVRVAASAWFPPAAGWEVIASKAGGAQVMACMEVGEQMLAVMIVSDPEVDRRAADQPEWQEQLDAELAEIPAITTSLARTARLQVKGEPGLCAPGDRTRVTPTAPPPTHRVGAPGAGVHPGAHRAVALAPERSIREHMAGADTARQSARPSLDVVALVLAADSVESGGRGITGGSVGIELPPTFVGRGRALRGIADLGLRAGRDGEHGMLFDLHAGVGLGVDVGALAFGWLGGGGFDTWSDAAEVTRSLYAYHGPAMRARAGRRVTFTVDARWLVRSGTDERRIAAGIATRIAGRSAGVAVEHIQLGSEDVIGVGLRFGLQ